MAPQTDSTLFDGGRRLPLVEDFYTIQGEGFHAGKPACYNKPYPIKYRALEIGNEFIVGYGLDYDQLGRSLKHIYVVTE